MTTVAEYGVSLGLTVIVNSHGDTWIDEADGGAFAAALPRFAALWRQVAAHFADAHADALVFEVYNEPHRMSAASLRALNAAVLPLIRRFSPTRGVLSGGCATPAARQRSGWVRRR